MFDQNNPAKPTSGFEIEQPSELLPVGGKVDDRDIIWALCAHRLVSNIDGYVLTEDGEVRMIEISQRARYTAHCEVIKNVKNFCRIVHD